MTSSLIARAEQLYADVVLSPGDWNDQRFAEWAEEVASDGAVGDRDGVRLLRRVIRAAARLQAFWVVEDASRPDDHGDWRTRVDIALGARAWRPVLDLAMHALESHPSPELFEMVKERFPVVTSQRWMEGVGYEEWLAER